MSAWIVILLVAAWICLIVAGFAYVLYRKEQQMVQQNLENALSLTTDSFNDPSKRTWEGSFIKWFDQLAAIGEKIQLLSDPDDLEDTLIKAGHPYGMTVKRLQGAKIVGAIAGFGGGFLYFILGLPFSPVIFAFSPMIGYLVPIWLMKYMARRRQEEIRYELPDFLDMMSITLQAGMGLDDALHYYVSTSKGPLSEELARLNQEIRFGVQREDAFRSLLRRTSSPEFEALIQSVIQAYRLGTPIADTFAQQADEMRRMRAEQAKERAGKAAPKITTVGSLVIAPSIMLLVFGMFVIKYFLSEDSPMRSFFE